LAAVSAHLVILVHSTTHQEIRYVQLVQLGLTIHFFEAPLHPPASIARLEHSIHHPNKLHVPCVRLERTISTLANFFKLHV
jgi:hypothetical protein